MVLFRDRVDAGQRLTERLGHVAGDVVVVGLPRGGVVVAAEVARTLGAPLDVVVVRKLGVPSQPELAMGAVGEDGVRVVDEQLVAAVRVSTDELRAIEERERAEVAGRAARFRDGRARLPLAGRTVVVVDDGVATGATAQAACEVVRAHGAARVVLAVPVAPRDWTVRLAGSADEFVTVDTPDRFRNVGQFYVDFAQTTDAEVVAHLAVAQRTARDDDR